MRVTNAGRLSAVPEVPVRLPSFKEGSFSGVAEAGHPRRPEADRGWSLRDAAARRGRAFPPAAAEALGPSSLRCRSSLKAAGIDSNSAHRRLACEARCWGRGAPRLRGRGRKPCARGSGACAQGSRALRARLQSFACKAKSLAHKVPRLARKAPELCVQGKKPRARGSEAGPQGSELCGRREKPCGRSAAPRSRGCRLR